MAEIDWDEVPLLRATDRDDDGKPCCLTCKSTIVAIEPDDASLPLKLVARTLSYDDAGRGKETVFKRFRGICPKGHPWRWITP
jgi:hypothetical protein